DELPDQVLLGIGPVAERRPFLAVPLRDAPSAAALVVLGREGERWHQAVGVEVLDHLEAGLELLAGEGGAGLGQGQARSLDRYRHAGDPDVVVGGPDEVAIAAAVARLDHLLDD